jgi:hypothetical protein
MEFEYIQALRDLDRKTPPFFIREALWNYPKTNSHKSALSALRQLDRRGSDGRGTVSTLIRMISVPPLAE